MPQSSQNAPQPARDGRPHSLGSILDTAMRPARDLAGRYGAQLDAQLTKLPHDAARLDFCEKQSAHWITLYEQWAHAVDSGLLDLKPGDPTAWDYTLTIAEIQKRKARYAPPPAAETPPFWTQAQP